MHGRRTVCKVHESKTIRAKQTMQKCIESSHKAFKGPKKPDSHTSDGSESGSLVPLAPDDSLVPLLLPHRTNSAFKKGDGTVKI